MNMSTRETPSEYRFDDVVVDCRNFRVVKSGEPRRVIPRAFEVLIFLIRNSGRVVTKQELFDSVWRESFVSDNALTRIVKEIRHAIGDDADAARYIETVPKRGYRFIALAREHQATGGIEPASNRTSIAVLPFLNEGKDAESEFLSEGITEDVINLLSKIPEFRIVPRSVVFAEGRDEVDPINSGRKMHVSNVVVGRIQQFGEKLIVSVELIDVQQESQIWGEKFNYPTIQILELQTEISRRIAENLRAKLSPAESKRPTEDAEAYRLYLRGRYFWNRRPQGLAKGIEYFEQALDRDPKFAMALAGLADSYNALASWESGLLPPNEAMPRARSAAEKALEIDPTLAEAHTALGYNEFHYDLNIERAEKSVRYALQLSPNYVHAHHWLSHLHMARGDVESSLTESRIAYELDPLDLIMNVHLMWHHWLARQPDEAVRLAEKTREIDHHSIWPEYFTGLAFQQKGSLREAESEYRRAAKHSPDVTLVQAALANTLGLMGDTSEARQIFDRLEKTRRKKFIPAYDLAIVKLGLGETSAALDWLEEARREHSGWMAYLAVEPRLDPLRGTPEFDRLQKSIGIPFA